MRRRKLSFVHGFMGHSSDWDQVRSRFSDHDSMAVDVRPASDWDASLQQLAADLPDHSVLIGYSMGARLALGIALQFPERCEGLVFISGNPGIENESEQQKRVERDEVIARRIETEDKTEFLKAWYEQTVFATVPEAVRLDEIQRKADRPSADWPAILRANSVGQQPNYWPRLPELSMPVLVLAGQQDEKYHMIASRLAQSCTAADVKISILPNCGHLVHRERTDAFTREVIDFLASL